MCCFLDSSVLVCFPEWSASEGVSARSRPQCVPPPKLCFPHVPMFAFLVGALTSGHTIACVPGELGLAKVGEAVVLVLGLPPMSHADADTCTRIQKPDSFICGGHMAVWGVGLTCTPQRMTCHFFPKR